MGALEAGGRGGGRRPPWAPPPGSPVAATAVPRLEGLLGRVPPRARQEQLEPDRPQAAGATRFLGEGRQRPADAGPAASRGRREHAELARVGGDLAEADGSGELAASGGDRDL